MLLNPRNAAEMQCEYLKIKGIHDPRPRTVFICSGNDCFTQPTLYYTYNSKCLCSLCGKLMDKTLQWTEEISGEGGIFVNDKHNFMITDGLRVIPSSLLKGLSLFKEMQITGAGMLEERVIDFGKEEILKLLRRSLVSNKVLTDVEKEINVKLVLNKENNNVLYAEVGVDFINLLFSFLTFPLGAVLRLVSEDLSLGGCIKNLYSSVNSMGLEHFKSKIHRNMLLNPKLPTFYGCNKNQIPQLDEITSIKLVSSKGCLKCYVTNGCTPCVSAPCEHGIKQAEFIEWNPKSAKIMADAGKGAFVVGSRKYMISDNLHISPLSIISAIDGGMNLLISYMAGKEISFDKVKVSEYNSFNFASLALFVHFNY
ncbi:hypothetical protein KSP39_PZI022641 [Platanthera zijinensis]|uniref:DUF674 family protein n=1 Tax=Platanthera zijinensis TaxID=2320716 RepID=A0AAP0AUY8_9ASPA